MKKIVNWDFQDNSIVDDEGTITYQELYQNVNILIEKLESTKYNNKLVFLFLENNTVSVINYLSIYLSELTALLIDNSMGTESIKKLVNTYTPSLIINNKKIKTLKENTGKKINIYSKLKILLSTSGSTGSPKLVALSKKNLLSNASAISKFLKLRNSRPFNSLIL